MKIWILSGLTALVVAAPSALAWAQAQPAADKAAKSPAPSAVAKDAKAPSAAELAGAVTKGQPAKPRVIDFEDETIRGTLTKPEGDLIDARKRGKQKSLIKIRPHFVPELLKSADDL